MTRSARLTWLGHATVLFELDGVRVLTDPLLRRRIFHLRRSVPPPPRPVDLDAVLVSHSHWDHLDVPSLRQLGKRMPLIVPRGLGTLLGRAGFTDVVEVEEGELARVGNVEIRATHAEHELGRLQRSRAPAIGFVLTASSRIYFAGDTDLFDGMSGLADELDAALLPIAGWGPGLPRGHLTPRTAAEALRLLRPRVAVPIHWGTYAAPGFGRRWSAAPAEFSRQAAELAPGVDVKILAPGESVAI